MVFRSDRTWVEISRSAIRHNLRTIRRIVGPVPIAPVIKANAYGHGAFGIADILKQEKIWGVCVAYGQEALQLRQHGWRKRILVLSFWRDDELPALVRRNVDFAVWDRPSLRAVMKLPRPLRSRARIHIKLDTGTSRIGFSEIDVALVKKSLRRSGVNTVGVFSHLANSEEAGTARTKLQILRFTTLSQRIGIKQGMTVHLACTAAALRYPEARFGLVRLGIGLYGLWPSEATKRAIKAKYPQVNLDAALTWKSRLSQVKRLPAGTSIGYGSTARLTRATLVGTVPVGYSDGYRRDWSNRAWVMIRGSRAPVIGRVSMNLLTVDLKRIPQARVEDEVILLGEGITADTLADIADTIHYEITTGINPLIPRISI